MLPGYYKPLEGWNAEMKATITSSSSIIAQNLVKIVANSFTRYYQKGRHPVAFLRTTKNILLTIGTI